ncbi:MAG: serine hydroxymethyltransferase [Bacteroidota bacterium]
MNADYIRSLIAKEKKRQENSIELIASENFVSDDVLEALGSVLTNKYAEGYPGKKRYYGGCEVVDAVEDEAIRLAKKLFNVGYANVQPHSGSQANAAVMLALLQPGDKILGFNLSHGGHLTHGSPVNFSGRLYRASFYGVQQPTGTIDFTAVARQIIQEQPRLVIAGASAYSRDWDYAILREAADQVGAFLLADIAHTAGFIACGLLNNPFPHCHLVTTTTHKTLRSARGGMILMGEDDDNQLGIRNAKGHLRSMSSLLDSAVFPGTQGGPQMHSIAAKAVGLAEALQPSYHHYMQKVRQNAQRMVQALQKQDYTIVSGGTDNHLFLIDLTKQNITGREAEKALEKAGISVNKNMIPFDPSSPWTTSGIRIGTPAITTRGIQDNEIERIVDLIHRALTAYQHESSLLAIKEEAKELMQSKPLFQQH